MLQHEGGEKFFDLLDDKIRIDIDLIHNMINFILDSNIYFDYIIVSGKFGRVFSNYINNNETKLSIHNIITVNGGLRKNNPIEKFWEIYDIKNKKLVFVDDSFYSGKTMNAIKNAIESNGGELIKTFCYYDGSESKLGDVESFYRWYR